MLEYLPCFKLCNNWRKSIIGFDEYEVCIDVHRRTLRSNENSLHSKLSMMYTEEVYIYSQQKKKRKKRKTSP